MVFFATLLHLGAVLGFIGPSMKTTNETLHLAYSAFCDEKAVMDWSCRWCEKSNGDITGVKYIKKFWEGTQGYVALDLSEKRIIVAFRGSKNLANGIEDALFWKTDFGPDDARVEYGFYTAYDSVHQDAMAGIGEALKKCPDCSLLWTGHSLGAAMATIGSIKWLAVNGTDRQSNLFTFGCPRVGNQAFVDYAVGLIKKSNSTNYRVDRQEDIVPTLPPEFIGYRHLPQEIWNRWSKNGTNWLVPCSPTNGEDPHCYDSEYNLNPAQHTMYLGFKGGWC